jgi:hypothetical protein
MELDYARGGRHPRIVEGDGSKEKPFVVDSNNPVSSAMIQQNVVKWVTGLQTVPTVRVYYESPKGQPGNGDLCQHQIKVGDEFASIWFDLYLVTKQGKEAGVPQDPVALIRKVKELAQGSEPDRPKEANDELSQLAVTRELSTEKTDSHTKEPTRPADSRTVSFVRNYACTSFVIILIQYTLIAGFAIWAYSSDTKALKSDRIIFGVLTAITTFLAFKTLNGIIGPWVSGHIAKVLSDSKAIKVNPYDMWFTRLFAVLGVLRVIITAGIAIYFVIKGWSPYDLGLNFALFSGFFGFCIAYIVCDIAFSLLFLLLGTICWIFDHRLTIGKLFKGQLTSIIIDLILLIGGGRLIGWLQYDQPFK